MLQRKKASRQKQVAEMFARLWLALHGTYGTDVYIRDPTVVNFLNLGPRGIDSDDFPGFNLLRCLGEPC